MPSSVGWRISSPDTQSEERLVWKEGAPHRDERAVGREAEDTALKEDAPHEEEAQVHDGAHGKLETVAEHNPVGEADDLPQRPFDLLQPTEGVRRRAAPSGEDRSGRSQLRVGGGWLF